MSILSVKTGNSLFPNGFLYSSDTLYPVDIEVDSIQSLYIGTNVVQKIYVGSLQIYPDVTPPIITVEPLGGTYSEIISVTMSSNEPATIYYTIDGTIPTINSNIYTSPIQLNQTITLKYFAKDSHENFSNVETIEYIINLPNLYSSDTLYPSNVLYPSG